MSRSEESLQTKKAMTLELRRSFIEMLGMDGEMFLMEDFSSSDSSDETELEYSQDSADDFSLQGSSSPLPDQSTPEPTEEARPEEPVQTEDRSQPHK